MNVLESFRNLIRSFKVIGYDLQAKPANSEDVDKLKFYMHPQLKTFFSNYQAFTFAEKKSITNIAIVPSFYLIPTEYLEEYSADLNEMLETMADILKIKKFKKFKGKTFVPFLRDGQSGMFFVDSKSGEVFGVSDEGFILCDGVTSLEDFFTHIAERAPEMLETVHIEGIEGEFINFKSEYDYKDLTE